jgi:hypothetical protein
MDFCLFTYFLSFKIAKFVNYYKWEYEYHDVVLNNLKHDWVR